MSTLQDRIEQHHFCKGLSPRHLEVFAADARELYHPAGAVIFRQGEPANKLYLVESGTVAVESHECTSEDCIVQHLGPDDVLGWSWMLPPFSWHFQARALSPCRLIEINAARVMVASEEDPAFGYIVMKRVAQVLLDRLQHTRQELLKKCCAQA